MQNVATYKFAKKVNNVNHAGELESLWGRAKDWYIQGLQLNKMYFDDWNEIKSIFSKLGLNLNEFSPILTIDSVKNVQLALKLSENPRGYIRKDVFLTTLNAMPIYCRHLGAKKFEKWMDTIEFAKVMDLQGTMKDKDKGMEQIIEPLFLGKKKDLKIKV